MNVRSVFRLSTIVLSSISTSSSSFPLASKPSYLALGLNTSEILAPSCPEELTSVHTLTLSTLLFDSSIPSHGQLLHLSLPRFRKLIHEQLAGSLHALIFLLAITIRTNTGCRSRVTSSTPPAFGASSAFHFDTLPCYHSE